MENQWQPIETAPKDESKFLMYITGFKYTKNNANDKYKRKEIKLICIADYVSQRNNFFASDGDGMCEFASDGDGMWEVDSLHFKGKDSLQSYTGYHEIEEYQATHWMPLPEAPIINNLI